MTVRFLLSVFTAYLAVIFAPTAPVASVAEDCSRVTLENSDDCVRLNQIQLLGTHNSYHIAPPPPLLAALGPQARDIDYTHRPLAEQLSELGIRKVELDVFADPEGGRFATPAAFHMVKGLDPIDPELRERGFKVLHTPYVDHRTTCVTLEACLATIRNWSRSHPSHVPIMVMIEAKDAPRDEPDGVGSVRPVPIGANDVPATALDTCRSQSIPYEPADIQLVVQDSRAPHVNVDLLTRSATGHARGATARLIVT